MKNAQGDVLQIRSKWGTTLVEYEYDAWGNCSIVYTHSAYGSFGEINPIRYRSYFYDFETGFYYLQSRYYDPAIRRFISADDPGMIGASGTFLSYNLYAYCENNPINLIDSGGRFGTPIQWAMAAIGAIAGWYFGDYVAHQLGYHWGWQYWIIRSGVVIGGAVIGWFAGTAITAIAKAFLIAHPSVMAKIPQGVLWFLGLSNLQTKLNFQNEVKLLEHYTKHASEWGGKFLNPGQYLNAANNLLNRTGAHIYQFTSSQGWLFKYDAIQNEFLLISPQGTISTFFRPINGMAYWLEQIAMYGG